MDYVYCLDYGTENIKIYDLDKNKIFIEKNAVAIRNNNELFAVGNIAYNMFYKSPNNINISFPMNNGTISYYSNMVYLLKNILSFQKTKFFDNQILIVATPTDVTDVEKRSFFNITQELSRKTSGIGMVEKSIAQCIGLGIDATTTRGTYIVDMGAETTEFSVIARSGIVYNKMLKTGGKSIDEAISDYYKDNNNVLLSMFDISNLKKELADTISNDNKCIELAGRNVRNGMPTKVNVSSAEINNIVRKYAEDLSTNIMKVYDKLPPDLKKAILRKGVYLCGGLSKIKHLKTFLEDYTGLKIHIYKNPEMAVVRGLKIIYETPDYRSYIYSIKK